MRTERGPCRVLKPSDTMMLFPTPFQGESSDHYGCNERLSHVLVPNAQTEPRVNVIEGKTKNYHRYPTMMPERS